jgi:hypothetical protein
MPRSRATASASRKHRRGVTATPRRRPHVVADMPADLEEQRRQPMAYRGSSQELVALDPPQLRGGHEALRARLSPPGGPRGSRRRTTRMLTRRPLRGVVPKVPADDRAIVRSATALGAELVHRGREGWAEARVGSNQGRHGSHCRTSRAGSGQFAGRSRLRASSSPRRTQSTSSRFTTIVRRAPRRCPCRRGTGSTHR